MVYYNENSGQPYPSLNYAMYNPYYPYHPYHPQFRPNAPNDFYGGYPSFPRQGWKQERMKTSRPRRHSAYYSYTIPDVSPHITTHQDPRMFKDQRKPKKKNRPRSSSTSDSFTTNNTSGSIQTNNNDASSNISINEETESLNSLEILAKENTKRNEDLCSMAPLSVPVSVDRDNISSLPSPNNEPLGQQNLKTTTEDPSPGSREVQPVDRSIPSTTSSQQKIKDKSRRWSFFDLFRKPSPADHTHPPTPADLERLQDTAKVAKMDHIWCFKTSDSPTRIIWTGFDYINQVILTDHANENELVLMDSHICKGSLPFLVVISQQLAYYAGPNNTIEKVEIKRLPNTKDTIVLRKRIYG